MCIIEYVAHKIKNERFRLEFLRKLLSKAGFK